MITKIIQERDFVDRVSFTLDFWFLGYEGNWGFGFACDELGKVDETKLCREARINYHKCLLGSHDRPVSRTGELNRHEWTEKIPAIGKCECGREVMLEGFTCACECGRDYNSSGTELAPREQWGEETGEHYSDILRVH